MAKTTETRIKIRRSGVNASAVVSSWFIVSLCRKTTGGGPASEITVDGKGFVWLAGQDLVTEGPKHAFCRVWGCHTPYPLADGNINVPVGALDGAPAMPSGANFR